MKTYEEIPKEVVVTLLEESLLMPKAIVYRNDLKRNEAVLICLILNSSIYDGTSDLSNQQIAKKIGIAERTVRKHLQNLQNLNFIQIEKFEDYRILIACHDFMEIFKRTVEELWEMIRDPEYHDVLQNLKPFKKSKPLNKDI